MEAVDAGNVTSAIVKQNKETPTGQLILLMKDNSHRQMYVSDVTAEQDFPDGEECSIYHPGCSA